ncbi:MFS transporter [Pedobacter rhizosphaerae]|uniref:Major Facilitator Superfamily protein n=1 Tax=Pedobacter rhizosphaerae TaxID=390241 RepID=A0A1H9U8H1_9SPHI|nr:MFS transporter [Pedobacter rhizosphaerae]SES05622.1 Major Facilitator Superfamily protein [Pedobacter rhizosphaerae]
MKADNPSNKRNVIFLVIVAALGYFVDIYDLVLFSVVRLKSFTDIGISPEKMRTDGEYVINMQMFGLLLGGVLWGIIGDKFGRIKVLFGSILMYSLANIANGFVTDVHSYALIRFIAGIGLAGELGAGITLVTETMDKEKRGYGTMVVAGIGLLGAAAAATIGKHYTWQTSYFVGGGMGLLLLLLRVGTFESGMFKNVVDAEKVSKGNFFMLFSDRKRFLKYLACICLGLPLWFIVGILVTQSPEIGKALGAKDVLNAGSGIMYTYFGIAIGDVVCGFLAQVLRSRRKTVLIFQSLSVITVIVYLTSQGLTEGRFIWICLFMGFAVGYWATFVTIAAEQFGTNIRSTVTTTAPNFVRGALIPITVVFEFFVHRFDIVSAAFIVMAIVTIIAIISVLSLKESFNKDLDYLEK